MASIEFENMFFDIAAVFALTAWSAEDWHPWWGVFVALAAAALAAGLVAGASHAMLAIANRLHRPNTPARLDAGTFGIRIARSRPRAQATIAWSDIEEIVTMKADMYTVDCLMLTVRTRANDIVMLDEQMDGWETVVDTLPTYLDCEPYATWFLNVAFPAFATNPRQIFPVTQLPLAIEEEAPTERLCQDVIADQPESRAVQLRTYLEAGTGGLFIAVAVVLAMIAFMKADPRLWRAAATIVAYIILTRALLAGLLALRRARAAS